MLVEILVAGIVIAAAVHLSILFRTAYLRQALRPRSEAVVLGAVTSFFDTLGIGSFAPTMAWFKFRSMVPDHVIPPTLLVGHTLATVVQALIFLILLGVMVDPVLLLGCIGASVVGGLLGAPLVSRARVRAVQRAVGIALMIAAATYLMVNLNLMPAGGTAPSLSWPLTLAAIGINFVLGILLNFGVGSYAPTLVTLSLMGLDPRFAFPIMAAAAAITFVGASARHIRAGEVDLRIALGMAMGGLPAVLVAAFLVKTMPLEVLRWVVMVVVLYAAAVMLRSSMKIGSSDFNN